MSNAALKSISCFRVWRRSVFHGEADFDGHLPVMHAAFFDVAARFNHLKPAQVLDGFVSALDGLAHGILDGSGGSAGEFDEFIDGIFHNCIVVSAEVAANGLK